MAGTMWSGGVRGLSTHTQHTTCLLHIATAPPTSLSVSKGQATVIQLQVSTASLPYTSFQRSLTIPELTILGF